jgi:lipoate synthase
MKRESSTGKFVRIVEDRRSGRPPIRVVILQPDIKPTSTTLREIRRAVREVHAASKGK